MKLLISLMNNSKPVSTEIVKSTSINGVFEIARPVFPDIRGQFHEMLRVSEIEQAINNQIGIKQINISKSRTNVLRGIHITPWAKLITCVSGEIFAAIVDTRPDSPTFKKIHSVTINDKNQITIYIPPGCGNSFLATGPDLNVYLYAVTMEYGQLPEIGLIWNDPSLKINWPTSNPDLSDKDKENLTLEKLLNLGILK